MSRERIINFEEARSRQGNFKVMPFFAEHQLLGLANVCEQYIGPDQVSGKYLKLLGMTNIARSEIMLDEVDLNLDMLKEMANIIVALPHEDKVKLHCLKSVRGVAGLAPKRVSFVKFIDGLGEQERQFNNSIIIADYKK